ncbi:MAG TPA: ABC transporter ATP-binding protein [Spirochaetota bacterium]|nr:ABC transporter ATP-binding protein [Spirochaetota bacterium]HPP94739.1 ABC transporter ATP-binding protein [Spirochaetota bacterium]
MIELKGVAFTLDENLTVEVDDLEISESEIVGITGNGGSGKSSLLKLLYGDIKDFEGCYFFDGKNISNISKKERKVIFYFLPPIADFNPEDTLFDHVIRGQLNYKKFLNPYSPSQKEMTSDIIHSLNLSHLSNHRLKSLSHSIIKMANLAQGINSQCKVLLMDSPELFLDFRQKITLTRTLKKYAATGKISIIVASSDLDFLIKLCDKIIFLKNGKIFATGHSEIITDSLIKEVFGVQSIISKNIISTLPEIHIIE